MSSYAGPTCSAQSTSYNFNNAGGLVLYNYEIPLSTRDDRIAFGITTKSKSGTVIHSKSVDTPDYLKVEMADTRLLVSYNTGGGSVELLHPQVLSDGAYHVVQIFRLGSNMTISIKGDAVNSNPSGSHHTVLHDQSQIEIGGILKSGKISQPFRGTLSGLTINGIYMLDLAAERDNKIRLIGDVIQVKEADYGIWVPDDRAMQKTPPSNPPLDDLVSSAGPPCSPQMSGCVDDEDSTCLYPYGTGSGDELITPIYIPSSFPLPRSIQTMVIQHHGGPPHIQPRGGLECDDEDCNIEGSGVLTSTQFSLSSSSVAPTNSNNLDDLVSSAVPPCSPQMSGSVDDYVLPIMQSCDDPSMVSSALESVVHSYSSVSFKIVQKAIAESSSSLHNSTFALSSWGEAAHLLFQKNNKADRQYLNSIYNLFTTKQLTHNLSLAVDITPAQLLQAAPSSQTLSTTYSDIYLRAGIWGAISIQLLHINTKESRIHLSSFWKLYMHVSSHSTQEMSNPQTSTIQNRERAAKTTRSLHNQRQYESNIARISQRRQLQRQEPDSDMEETVPHNLTTELENTFTKSILQFPTAICDACDKLVYPAKMKNFTLSLQAQKAMQLVGHNETVGTKLCLCDRCHSNMSRGRLSPQTKFNNMQLEPIPPVIAALSVAEIRLVSQVKLFMKIFYLSKGRGQPALKGLVIHFPQKVNEVIHQLPLQLPESDMLLISEDFTGVETVKEFHISPERVYSALQWFKANNKLYANIDIVQLPLHEISSICLQQDPDPIMSIPVVIQSEANSVYQPLTSTSSILRASTHQGHAIFLPNSGKQCGTMSAAYLAFAFVQSPHTWTKETLDQVLMCGNNYYTLKLETLPNTEVQLFLTPDEVTGTIENIFHSVSVNLNIDITDQFRLQGFLNKYPGRVPRLKETLEEFLRMSYTYALLTTAGYTVGIYKDEHHVILFDSHSRGTKGCKANDGTACLLKYIISEASHKISFVVHHNVQPNISASKLANLTEEQRNRMFGFTIIPFTCSIPNEDEVNIQNEDDVQSDDAVQSSEDVPLTSSAATTPCNSPNRKRPRRAELQHHETDNPVNPVDETPMPMPQLVPNTINGAGVTDCVIAADDFIEPRAQQIIDLHRTAGRPISSSFDKSLDILAFPHLFPHGTNGLNEPRKIKITPPDYFQQRLMSADKRFCGNTDLLFYALAESDKYRVQQKIGIVCLQRNQVGDNYRQENDLPPGAFDPSSYMSSIRGSAPYWKKYCGDLIAMIKQLGIPTFFLTFSFDDLNSIDAVTALWIAEHGPAIAVPTNLSFDDRKNLLNKHPIAAARHFSMRVSKFLALLQKRSSDIFGKPLLDFTIRIEFQGRGSPHAHCLLWLADVPGLDTEEGLQFIDRNVSCSLGTHSKDLVLKYQNHKHSSTCFKGKNSKRCRFQFPKKPCETTTVLDEQDIVKNGGKFVDLKRTKEEVMINNYHPILLHILKCNMDVQPVTGEMAIAFYIAKYMSKSEPAEVRAQIQASIETVQKSNLNARQKMNKIAMTLMKHREISAQEAAFRLCHLFLRKSSRVCVFVPAFQKESRLRMVRKETLGQDAQFCLNVIDRYIARPTSMEHICLFEFAAYYSPFVDRNHREDNDDDVEEFEEIVQVRGRRTVYTLLNNKGKIVDRGFAAVVKYPNFDITRDKDSYYYCLILLYLPFRDETFCDNKVPIEVFKEQHSSFRKHSDDSVINHDLAERIDQALIRITEFAATDNVDLELEEAFDIEYEDVDEVPLTAEEVFNEEPLNLVEQIKDMVATLSIEQKNVFLEVDRALRSGQSEQIKLIVCGEGGTGKSYLIRLLSLLIRTYTNRANSLIIAAPTGKAAFNVQGTTMHRAFALPVELGSIATYHRLGSRKLEELRSLYTSVKFLFFDEYSMISYESLRMVHRRLTEIFASDESFGDKSIILFGDLMQLKPPRGSWIFKKPERFRAEPDLWRLMHYFELKFNHRQAGIDPLLAICSRLRVGKLELADIEVLQTRLMTPDHPDYAAMQEKFNNCAWVFPKLKQVDSHNKLKAEELMKTTNVFRILARDTYADGLQHGREVPADMVYQDDKRCGGLPKLLELGIGTRVMYRINKDVKKGLVNGALGTIVSFNWTFGHQQQEGGIPQSVSIKFDHLDQPILTHPHSVDFTGKRQKRVTRFMLPYIQAEAINTHKIQGDSVDLIVLDLGKDLFAKGMAYVGISRPRTLGGLAIIRMDVNKLVTSIKYCPCDTDALHELERLREHFQISQNT